MVAPTWNLSVTHGSGYRVAINVAQYNIINLLKTLTSFRTCV